MTEQSKIPLPEDDGGEGSTARSLFERASGAFGLDALRPAPVPKRLDEPATKRAKPAPAERQPEPDSASPASFEPAAQRPPEPETSAPIVVPETASVRFAGTRHQIDRKHLRDQGLIVPEDGVSELLEEFRIVKRELLGAAKERGTAAARRVLVCSPHPGEGKTFCAVNLAIAMAGERECEVLLVDADFAKPSILSALGLRKAPGFMDVLANPELNPEDMVVGTDIAGLWVLPAGNMTNSDSEYLSSSRTAEVLDRLTVGAPNRMVIFDSPPALAASPAAELAKHVGQAVLIARADRTGQSALEDAVRLLSGCEDIKLLLNAAHFSPSGRRFGTYYGYEG